MEQTGEYRIAAARQEVWAALNDPDVLARCLDGCQSMKLADDRFHARIKAKVGPVRATFEADLTLEDVVPGARYTIVAGVKGGPAGFARGRAHVQLSDAAPGTLLAYSVSASIGGKLAQVGSRLIDGTARKMAEDFFARFQQELGGPAPAAAADESSGEASEGPEPGSHSPAGHHRAAPPGGGGNGQGAAAVAEEARAEAAGNKWVIWLAIGMAVLLGLLLAL